MSCTVSRVVAVGITILMFLSTSGSIVLFSNVLGPLFFPVPYYFDREENMANSTTQNGSSPCEARVTSCRVLSATFVVASGRDCAPLRYEFAVQSLTNPSEWIGGYYGFSCDDPNGNCCGGVLISESEAASGNLTLPCWISNPDTKFVNIATDPPTCQPSQPTPAPPPSIISGMATFCTLHSAKFFVIKSSFCFSLRYDLTVQSLANSSVWASGYYGVSCDAADGNCCNGILIPESDAVKGIITLPCWISNLKGNFVNIVAPAPIKRLPAPVGMATVCKLHSAKFLVIKSSFCFSLVYNVSVQSLTDPSAWIEGYRAVSCDATDGNCCNGILIPESDAVKGIITLPCWLPDENDKTVRITTPAPIRPTAPEIAPLGCKEVVTTSCKLLNATYKIAKNSTCTSLRYDVAVQSTTNLSIWTKGYYGVSCDDPNGDCCNGLLISWELASAENATFPCWTTTNESQRFVRMITPPPTCASTYWDNTLVVLVTRVIGGVACAAVLFALVAFVSYCPTAIRVRMEFELAFQTVLDSLPQLSCSQARHVAPPGRIHVPQANPLVLRPVIRVPANPLVPRPGPTPVQAEAGTYFDDVVAQIGQNIVEECSICQEPLGMAYCILRCGHRYHGRPCLEGQINLSSRSQCAICRAAIDIAHTVPVR
ncbi:GPI-anchored surface protein, putative [Bodo saltans]|uniref:GPI-anchored surface protein, putative n=1 Tax=Bodo saltans TaxID=75058 RepID=A0A0S4ITH7_BODSA|nr:GPI-anchored surface protein, putative [Bodo saltans]|eukprot:CUF86261.1 GPI-anchored surface protein, putative [Bodo saltans]